MKSARGARAAPERLRGGRTSRSVRARDEPLAARGRLFRAVVGADRPRRRAGRRGDRGLARRARRPRGYWTAERMADARPLDVVRGGSGPALRLAPQPPPFESFAVPDPTAPPLTTHGKVFGVLPGIGALRVLGDGRRERLAPRRVHRRTLRLRPAHRDRRRAAHLRARLRPTAPGRSGAGARSAARTTRRLGSQGELRLRLRDPDHAPARRAPDRGGGRRAAAGNRDAARRRSTPPTATRSNFADAQRMWELPRRLRGRRPAPDPGRSAADRDGVRHDRRAPAAAAGSTRSASWSRSRASATSGGRASSTGRT